MAPNNGTSSVDALGETLIPIIAKLQEILHSAHLPDECNIQLPEVAVVGSQSSGKSSVLESLVGRDFLPRGPDICTRRPLVLNLRQLDPVDGENPPDWAEFPAHLPGKRLEDFAAVRAEIEAETNRLLGNSDKDVSDKPIHLTIHSVNVLTMSLIDLPGMTRVPVRGQPDNIASKLEALIMKFIRNPSCIILAVSAANADLANSDAIALARSVDPQGLRTIGVLTKLDIMDRGTDALRMLRNDVLPLRLGYIGVVNRSQHDIKQGTPVTIARENEAKFFAMHPNYNTVASQCGVPALGRRIQGILIAHIKQRLPELKEEISSRERQRREELISLGTAISDANDEAARAALLRLLGEYSSNFSDGLQGRQGHQPMLMENALQGGARIRHVFQEIFSAVLDELDPCAGMSDDQIWTVMNNCAGVGKPLVLSKEAFEVLVKKSMKQLQNPGMQCLAMVTKELLRIAESCAPREVVRYPVLHEQLSQLVRNFITKAATKAEEMLVSLFECEMAYINVDHPSFVGLHAAWQDHMDRRDTSADVSDTESASGNGHGHGAGQRDMGQSGLSRVHPNRSHHKAQSRHTVLAITDGRSAPGQADEVANLQSGEGEEQQGWFPFWGRRDQRGSDAPGMEPHAAIGLGAITGMGSSAGGLLNGPLMPSAPSMLVSKVRSQRERDAVNVMRKLIKSYFNVVRDSMKDLVPKVVMRFVVLQTESNIHRHLIASLLRGNERKLMQERPDVAQRRRALASAVSVLSQAMDQLQLVPRELEVHADGLDSESGGDHHEPDALGLNLVGSKGLRGSALQMYTAMNASAGGLVTPRPEASPEGSTTGA